MEKSLEDDRLAVQQETLALAGQLAHAEVFLDAVACPIAVGNFHAQRVNGRRRRTPECQAVQRQIEALTARSSGIKTSSLIPCGSVVARMPIFPGAVNVDRPGIRQ